MSDTLWPQAPLFVGFSRQEYWSGLPWSPPRDLPEPWIEPKISWVSWLWQVRSLPQVPLWQSYLHRKATFVGQIQNFQGKGCRIPCELPKPWSATRCFQSSNKCLMFFPLVFGFLSIATETVLCNIHGMERTINGISFHKLSVGKMIIFDFKSFS